jgi:hypothetical protein
VSVSYGSRKQSSGSTVTKRFTKWNNSAEGQFEVNQREKIALNPSGQELRSTAAGRHSVGILRAERQFGPNIIVNSIFTSHEHRSSIRKSTGVIAHRAIPARRITRFRWLPEDNEPSARGRWLTAFTAKCATATAYGIKDGIWAAARPTCRKQPSACQWPRLSFRRACVAVFERDDGTEAFLAVPTRLIVRRQTAQRTTCYFASVSQARNVIRRPAGTSRA